MALVLIIAGAVWLSFSLIFVLALMCAARRGIPPEVQPVAEPLTNTEAARAAESPLVVVHEEDISAAVEIDEPIPAQSGIA